jgi:hypothetical protein
MIPRSLHIGEWAKCPQIATSKFPHSIQILLGNYLELAQMELDEANCPDLNGKDSQIWIGAIYAL